MYHWSNQFDHSDTKVRHGKEGSNQMPWHLIDRVYDKNLLGKIEMSSIYIVRVDVMEEPQKMLYNGNAWKEGDILVNWKCLGSIYHTVSLPVKTEEHVFFRNEIN